MQKFISLLKREHVFARLSLIQLICYFGVWFSHTGVFTLLIELDAPVWAITLAAAMAFLPGVVLAPFSGVIVDKFNPKPMLVALIIVEAVTVFILIFINSLDLLWLLFIIIFVRSAAGGTYFQVEMSMFPKILSKSDLKLANEIHALIFSISYTSGMGLAGIYIHFFGIKSAFLLDCALYILTLFMLLKIDIKNIAKNTGKSALNMLKEGLSYMKQNPLVMHLIILHSIVGVTSYDALVALLADYQYKELLSASLVIGFINACRSIALLIGPIVLSKFINTKTLVYIYIGHGIGVCVWGILQFNFYLGFLGTMAAGFFTSSLWSYTFTLLQQKCDDKYYGRIIAYNDMIYLGIGALTSAGIGLLFRLGLSLWGITIIMGCMFFLGAIYWSVVYKKYQDTLD
ncbi:MFS transporter [Campylobacter sp. RM16192]|uniref:MFS transporter n=1 Tax=Campylobacter sp. RM16192 TaxID=1660080 RepID=UPI001452847F|nr:MFS transporter [Campylobacter sp. RM16192]QCD52924.1 H+ antiporter protein, major facilitator superfamily [Campylobacter sp. RM16192]